MKRPLLTFASILSLLAILTLWIVSERRVMWVDVACGARRLVCGADRGSALLLLSPALPRVVHGIRYGYMKRTGETVLDEMSWKFWGFGGVHSQWGDYGFCFPLWLVLVFCATATLIIARPWRAPRRTGLCHRCGYDLRASQTRCPECGTPIPGEAPA